MRLGWPAARVVSSGVWAQEGRPCPPPAVEAAETFGVDLSGHRARRTRPAELARARWVAAMEFGQAAELERLLGEAAEPRPSLLLLGEYAPGAGVEIPDPYGLAARAYEAVYRVVWAATEALVEALRRGEPT